MKKIIMGLLVASVASVASAEYLFWQVSDRTLTDDARLSSVVSTPLSDYYALVHYTDDGGATSKGTLGVSSGYALGGDGTLDTSYAVDLGTLANAASYSYYIEIVNSATSDQVARSQIASYTSLAESAFIADMVDISRVNVWTGGKYGAAPEPTSAVLMMLGMALVGLKRKRV